MDLQEVRPWIVYLHIVAAFGFALAHGVSVFAAFAIRATREPERIRALLELSGRSIGATYLALLVLLVAGIIAAIQAEQFGSGWPWAAIGLLVLLIAAMWAMGSRYYSRVREAVGLRSQSTPKEAPDPVPASPGELDALLRSRIPEALLAIGGVGLLVMLWLMRFRPF